MPPKGSTKTTRLLNNMQPETHKVTPIAKEMVLPNLSGIASHPEAQGAYVKKAGDTMTGDLTIKDPALGDWTQINFKDENGLEKARIFGDNDGLLHILPFENGVDEGQVNIWGDLAVGAIWNFGGTGTLGTPGIPWPTANIVDLTVTSFTGTSPITSNSEIDMQENVLSGVQDVTAVGDITFYPDGNLVGSGQGLTLFEHFTSGAVTLKTKNKGTLTIDDNLEILGSTLTVGNTSALSLAEGSITDSSGAISFGNENLTTTGTLNAAATTVGTLTTGNSVTIGKNNAATQTITFNSNSTDRTIVYDGSDTPHPSFAIDGRVTVKPDFILEDSTAIRAVRYRDTDTTSQRLCFSVAANTNDVEISNRAANGTVEIHANTSTAGAGGDVAVALFEDDLINLKQDTIWTGNGGLPYGDMSATGNSTATTISVAGTPVQVTIFDTNGASNLTTPDHTNDHITITKSGTYMITVSATVNSVAGAASRFEMTTKRNNGAVTLTTIHRNVGGGGVESGVISMNTIAQLATTDTIEVWIENETNTQNYVVEDISLSVVMIGA